MLSNWNLPEASQSRVREAETDRELLPTNLPTGNGSYSPFQRLGSPRCAAQIDPHAASSYHFRQCPLPHNPLGRRFPITASSAKSAAGGWVGLLLPQPAKFDTMKAARMSIFEADCEAKNLLRTTDSSLWTPPCQVGGLARIT